MIVEAGHYALVLALALALVQCVVPVIGARLHEPRLTSVAGPVAVAQFAFVLFAFGGLTMSYVVSDFSVVNVFENSHSLKPLIYKITGVWGNHEGSMLLWVLILALFSALVAIFGANLPLTLRSLVLAVQGWIAGAFYLFILITSNPFLRIAEPPIEGRDLNPVLQDIGLAVHPPLLYLGYVGFSISFSFAIAALIEGRIGAAWARWVRPWTLLAWIFLTLGIAMGSYWPITILAGRCFGSGIGRERVADAWIAGNRAVAFGRGDGEAHALKSDHSAATWLLAVAALGTSWCDPVC